MEGTSQLNGGAHPQIQDDLALEIENVFFDFLDGYKKQMDPTDGALYVRQLDIMIQDDSLSLPVDYDDILAYSSDLAETITNNFHRFESALNRALTRLVTKYHQGHARDGTKTKDFQLTIHNLNYSTPIRGLKSQCLGKLLSIGGTVVRTSEVRPELLEGTFVCEECQTIAMPVMQQFKYTEPIICRNPQCNNKRRWTLLPEKSRFCDWQRVRVQEKSSEIPPGSMPRSIDIVLRHEACETAKAGDDCVFTGHLIVIPDIGQMMLRGRDGTRTVQRRPMGGKNSEGFTGLKSLGVRDMTYRMAFLATSVQANVSQMGRGNQAGGSGGANRSERETARDLEKILTPTELNKVTEIKDDVNKYEKLVASVAPSVFGHESVKQGVLLMLLGGVHKETLQGISLRGDLNVCIVGDPSTAKSQFLKYVSSFVPRSVYTSGKSSSAAGLTATVVRDEETNEFCVEAGALMLADNGVCCIDEFDKMDLTDQVAIHEAMEQQTISIAKAGIQATLNARTSILAAANPIGGRYDTSKTLRQNVMMTPPIMSRFDLFFVISDICDDVSDYNVARHIVSLHQNKDSAINPPYSTHELFHYIRFARTFQPQTTPQAEDLMVQLYTQLRQHDSGGNRASYRITVRQLESMIRLSEALARLHCDDQIKPAYVKEAYRLLRSSVKRVDTEEVELVDSNVQADLEVDKETMEVDEAPTPQAPSPEKQVQKLSYRNYQRMAMMIVHHLREPNVEEEGLTRQQVVDWYMNQKQDEIHTEEDYHEMARLLNNVIQRMLLKDNLLIELSGLDETSDTEAEKVLFVHPNYDETNDLRVQR